MNTVKLKTLVIAVVLGFSTSISAINNAASKIEKDDVITNITKDVQKLLKSSDLTLGVTEKAIVKFMVNSKNEIVVLSVDTSNKEVDAFVKGKLNYKKVSVKATTEIYTLPIKVLANK